MNRADVCGLHCDLKASIGPCQVICQILRWELLDQQDIEAEGRSALPGTTQD